jgi:thiol-disulfide isomerase/thioredoxin
MNDETIQDELPAESADRERLDTVPGLEFHDDGFVVEEGSEHEADDGTVTIGVSTIGLLGLAVLALAIGFGFGRVLRGGDAVQTASSAPAPFEARPEWSLPKSNHPLVGGIAPDFSMTLLDSGEAVSLSDFRGGAVMVNFWATWCPPCRAEMPWLQAAAETHQDLTILAVNAGERVPAEMAPETIGMFVRQMGLTFPILYGPEAYEVQTEWQVWGLPATFLVSPDGTVADSHQGMYPGQQVLEQQIRQFLAEQQG